MNPGTFFPYRVTPSVQLDLATIGANIHREGERSLDAYSEVPDRVTLECEVVVDWDAATDVVDGDPRAQLDLCLRIRGIRSRRRILQRIPNRSDRMSVEVELDRSDWVGTVSIEAVLLRQDRGRLVQGLAHDRGAMVGWSGPITVHFDEPTTSLPGDHLDVRWVHFQADPSLAQWSGHLFAVTPDTPPTILLNLDVPEAYAILSSKGTSGRKARIRDIVYDQIAHQVWTSLIANAVDNLGEQADGDSSVDDQLKLLEEYEERILRDWAPDLYPEREPSEVLEEVLEAARSRRVDDLLLRRVPHAIQHRLRTFDGFNGLVREAGLLGPDS